MTKRQKGKGGKRKKSWHRGRPEGRRAARALRRLPVVSDTPPTGAPEPVRRGPGGQNRGDTA